MFMFQHCFNNPSGAIELISIQSQIWIELDIALIQIGQDHDHIAFNIIKGKYEFELNHIDQTKVLNSTGEQ